MKNENFTRTKIGLSSMVNEDEDIKYRTKTKWTYLKKKEK